ncbi:MAG: hypothetical protein AAF433_13005 [Bacteroidota bacterium]
MADYLKMSNREALALQTALGTFRPGLWFRGDEMILLLSGSTLALYKDWFPAITLIVVALFLLAIGLILRRYRQLIVAPKRAIRKDLIDLEKKVIRVRLQYKTFEVKTELHYLHISEVDYPIAVSPQVYHELQAGEKFELSLARHSKVLLGYTKLLG